LNKDGVKWNCFWCKKFGPAPKNPVRINNSDGNSITDEVTIGSTGDYVFIIFRGTKSRSFMEYFTNWPQNFDYRLADFDEKGVKVQTAFNSIWQLLKKKNNGKF